MNNFKVGDLVAVGTFVDSCRDCEHCIERNEVLCSEHPIFTFNSLDKYGMITMGGYSGHIVVSERQANLNLH